MSEPPNLLDLDGRIALVTGAGQGVGATTAVSYTHLTLPTTPYV